MWVLLLNTMLDIYYLRECTLLGDGLVLRPNCKNHSSFL